jgi:hypothetical protein
MEPEQKIEADRRLEAALESSGVRDPRPYFRPVLKYLRDEDPAAFGRALQYHEGVLIPAVAGGADPLGAWLEYGLRLAGAMGTGRTVEVDATGRARTLETAVPDVAAASGLVLHLPEDGAAPALVLRYPGASAPAQDATVELLVAGRLSASAYDG